MADTAGSELIVCGMCGQQIFPGYAHVCMRTDKFVYPQLQYTVSKEDEILQKLNNIEDLLRQLVSAIKQA